MRRAPAWDPVLGETLAAVRAKVVRASETAEVTEAVVGVVAVSGVVVISAVQVPGRVKAHRLVGSAQEVAQVAVLAETVGAVDSADRVEGILAPAVVSVVDGPAVGWGLRVALCPAVADQAAVALVVDPVVEPWEDDPPVVSPLGVVLAGLLEEVRGNDQGVRLATSRTPGG